MTWDTEHIVKIAADSIAGWAAAADAEQAVRGVDALDELDLHPILAEGFARSGFGVTREWPFPGTGGVRGAIARARKLKASERDRCDMVLTPRPGLSPADPVAEEAARRAAAATLFADVTGAPSEDAPPLCAASECCWIEVKSVGQFVYRHGVPGPNSSYSSELTAAFATDLRKLGSDRVIQHGIALGVIFAAREEIIAHDVPIALHRCLDRGIRFGSPRRGGFPIADRAGNHWCEVWGVPSVREDAGLFD